MECEPPETKQSSSLSKLLKYIYARGANEKPKKREKSIKELLSSLNFETLDRESQG